MLSWACLFCSARGHTSAGPLISVGNMLTVVCVCGGRGGRGGASYIKESVYLAESNLVSINNKANILYSICVTPASLSQLPGWEE